MNIPVENIKKAISKGISVEAYVFLAIINDGCLHLFAENTFASVAKQLEMNGMCTGNEITEKGRKLLEEIEGNVSNKVDNSGKYKLLKASLQARLLEKCGKKQIQGFGGVYFIPTEKELEEFLNRFWKNYPDMKEIIKISKCLENHIDSCVKKNSFAPAIKYYIFKQGTGSQLAGAYENFEDSVEEIKKEDKLINTKELF